MRIAFALKDGSLLSMRPSLSVDFDYITWPKNCAGKNRITKKCAIMGKKMCIKIKA